MPNKLEQFLCVIDDNNVDKALLSESVVKNTLNSIENFGEDLGESVENFFQSTKKTPPSKPSTPTPTYAESAFLEPKHETTLYDVTNKKHEVPEVTKDSNIFKKLSYSFRGFTASVDYKQDNSKYRVFAGEKNRTWLRKKEITVQKPHLAHYLMLKTANLHLITLLEIKEKLTEFHYLTKMELAEHLLSILWVKSALVYLLIKTVAR